MQLTRTHLALAGLLLLQALLILVFRSPFADASVGSELRPLLPALEAVSPARVELLGSDDEKVTLVKQGDEWTVEEADGFPADRLKVEELLRDLEGLAVRRPVVSGSRYHETFRVADGDYEARLRIWGEGTGDPQVDLLLGTSPNYRSIHVRRSEEDPVYAVSGLGTYDVRPEKSAWIRTEFVRPAAGEITGFTLTNESGSFELDRGETGWTIVAPAAMAGRQVDADGVDAFLRSATAIRLTDAVGRKREPENAAATLVLRYAGAGQDPEAEQSLEQTVRVGPKAGDTETQRYVDFSDSDFAGTVWESSVKRLLEERIDDLLAETDS